MTTKVKSAIQDGIGVVGAGCVTYGAGQVYGPAGWMVAGAMLLALWVWSLPRSRK